MILLKACQRCHTGDVVTDRDMYGLYILCLQCGYMKDLANQVEADGILQRRPQDSRFVTRSA